VGAFLSAVNEERVRRLVDAGMYRINVGMQSGSMRVLHQVYKRPGTKEQIVQTFETLGKFKGRLTPLYQYILDNPWETEEDQLETLRQLFLIPRPYILELFSLTFFPGTELAERAIKEGLITDEHAQVYRKIQSIKNLSYVNALFHLFEAQHVPHWVIRLLMAAPLRRLGWVRLPRLADKAFRILARLHRGALHLLRGDWAWVRQAIRRV